MDFQLTDEQKLLKQTARKISKKEFQPRAAEIDATEEFPWDNKDLLAISHKFAISIDV